MGSPRWRACGLGEEIAVKKDGGHQVLDVLFFFLILIFIRLLKVTFHLQ